MQYLGKKQWLLTAVSLVSLAVFFALPRNNAWLNERFLGYLKVMPEAFSHRDEEYRKQIRWGKAYTLSIQLARSAKLIGIDNNSLIIMPTEAYFKKRNIIYPVPEPSVFYYYTGLKTVSPFSKDALKATCIVSAIKGKITIRSVKKPEELIEGLKALR